MATGETKNITGSLSLEDRYQTTIYDDILTISGANISLLDPAGEIFTDKGNDTVTVTNSTITNNSETGAELMFSMGSGDDSLDISNTTLNVNTFMGSGNDTVTVAGGIFSEVTINKQFSLGTGDDTLTLKSVLAGSGDLFFGDGNDTLVLDGGHLQTGTISAGLEHLVVTGNSGSILNGLTLSGEMTSLTLNGNLSAKNSSKTLFITSGDLESGINTLTTANNVSINGIGLSIRNVTFTHANGGTLEIKNVSGLPVNVYNSTVSLHDLVIADCTGGIKGENSIFCLQNANIANGGYGFDFIGGNMDLQHVGISNNLTGAKLTNTKLIGADVSFSAHTNRAISATDSDIEINKGRFYNNHCQARTSSSAYATSAYATAYGGAIAQSGGDLTLTDVSFSGNYVSAYATDYAKTTAIAYGGAIAQSGGDLTLTDVSFSGNYAVASASASYLVGYRAYATAYGGAIAQSGGDLTLTDVSFSGNYASANASAIHHQRGTAFLTADATAYATAYGGAISQSGGDLTLTDVSFSGNYAVASASANASLHACATANVYGGAIAAENSIINFTDVSFSGNYASATATAYSADYSYATAYATALGGAIYLKNSTMNYLVSKDNNLVNTGNEASVGGFIYLDGTSTAIFDIQGTFTVGDSSGNDSIAGSETSTIIKTGSGTWTVNSDISEFTGYWNINDGILKLVRIARNITLDNWTIGVDAELHLSELNDSITMNVDKKIGTIDLGGGSDTINTGGYHLSDGILRISTLTLTGGGKVSSQITNRIAGSGFDLILDDVTLNSIITGGSAADKITITKSSTIGGALNLGNGANIISASVNTTTTFEQAVTLGTGKDTLSFADVKFNNSLALGNGANTLTATGDAVITGAFTAGSGDDILNLGTVQFGSTANFGGGSDTLTLTKATFSRDVDLGDGTNKITATTAIFNGDLIAGSGNDTINLKQNSELRGNIALGGGRNYIYVTQNLTITDGFTLDSNGETHLVVYNNASLSSNTLNVYAPNNSNNVTVSYDWSDVAGLDKVRILVSSDATFETFEFAVELYNQSKEFTLNVSDNYFIQFQAQDEDGWSHRILTDTDAPDRVSGFAMDGTTAVWDATHDNWGGNGVKKYNIQVASDANFNSLIGTYTSTENAYDFSSFADGNYFIRIQAEDYTGNKGEWSNAENLLIDTNAPTKPASVTAASSADSITANWSASTDAGSGVKEYKVEFSTSSDFAEIAHSATVSGTTCTANGLADGKYYIRVAAVDNVNNTGSWSSVANAMIDTTAPGTVAGVKASQNSGVVSLSWNTASDTGVGVKEYIVEYSTNSSFSSIAGTKTVSGTSCSVSGLDDGTYYFRVKAIDKNDNTGSWSNAATALIDGTAPTVPGNLSASTGTYNVILNWNAASDALSGVKEYEYIISSDSNFNSITHSGKTTALNKSIFDIDYGTYYCKVRAIDNYGNVGEWSTSKSFSIADATKPELTLSADTTLWTNQSVAISASAVDSESGIKTIEYSTDNKNWKTGSTVSVNANGTVYFRATDNDGNVTSKSISVTNIDKTVPAIPVEFNESISGYNAKLDWSEAADIGVSGVKGYYVRYGTSELLTGEGKFITASEFDLTDLAVGTYYYQVKTLDNANNISEWSAVQSFEIIPGAVQNLRGDSNGLSWDTIPGAAGYIVEYSKDNFVNVMTLQTTGNHVDSFALSAGTYQWRVKAIAGEFVNGKNIISNNTTAAQKLISDADGNMDLFFGNVNGTWGDGFAAQNAATKELVALNGKNKIIDLFMGSSDANVLVLTDDANGDALFIDDMYSALGNQARLSQIDEIRAGAGNDIVDLTSNKYAFAGDKLTVYGGAGNDTIWANSGNDILIGGTGNDSLFGGGGNDTFIFGANWGKDTVEQLASGKVTLHFASGSMNNWNAATQVYSDGTNSVKVTGTSDITLKFGEDASLPAGVFTDAVNEKIFEDNKAMLA